MSAPNVVAKPIILSCQLSTRTTLMKVDSFSIGNTILRYVVMGVARSASAMSQSAAKTKTTPQKVRHTLPKRRHNISGIAPDFAAANNFVDPSRVTELEALPRKEYDVTKLIQLVVELNRAYSAHSYYSCLFLVRAIVDHVPPIFGQPTFAGVASSYAGGGRSFRESMQRLQNSCRKIADGLLHTQIRATESVPTSRQVEFRADVDALLAEVTRVLRSDR